MDIKWEAPPEFAKRVGKRPGRYAEFAAQLRENPGKWARMPNDDNRKANSAEALAQNIRGNRMKGFETGKWDTATHEGDVWLCYTGPSPTSTTTTLQGDGDDPPSGDDDETNNDTDAEQNGEGATSPKVIRAWAKAKGMDVPDRGRLPAQLIEAYEAALAEED